MRHGNGRFVSIEGDVYTGQWRNDLKHGYGKLIKADGEVLKGFWYRGRLNGMVWLHKKGRDKVKVIYKNDL